MKGVPMYVGLAAYRYGQKGFESVDEFRQQIDECREAPWVHGHAWFSAKCILTDEFKAFLMEGPYKDESFDRREPRLIDTGLILRPWLSS